MSAVTIAFPDPRPPVPPAELISRVLPHFGPDQAGEMQTMWHAHGEITVRAQERALAAVGRSFGEFSRLLDFGCGPGRSLGLMGALAGSVELHGVDIDRDAIAWAGRELPFAAWHVGPHEPPLPFDDGHFDLVVNHSVFTHLDERMQDLWLAELRRVVAPGGVLLLTVHGETMTQAMLDGVAGGGEDPAPYVDVLRDRGILFVEDDGYVGSVHPEYYHSTYHAPWYVYAHWGRFFTVRALLSPGTFGGHDIVVLERPAGDEPAVRPIGPRVGAGAGASVPASAAAPVVAPLAGAGPGLTDVVNAWPPPRTSIGRIKRRLLAAEYDLLRRLAAAADASSARAGEVPGVAEGEGEGEGGEGSRRERMLRLGLYQQGERLTLVERELRERLDALERRDR